LPKSDGTTNTFFPVGMDMKWGEIYEEYQLKKKKKKKNKNGKRLSDENEI
jgi:hypothetical protein